MSAPTLYRLRKHPEAGVFASATLAVLFALFHGLDPSWEACS